MARGLPASRRERGALRGALGRRNGEPREQFAILGAEPAAEIVEFSPDWPDWVAEEPGLWA